MKAALQKPDVFPTPPELSAYMLERWFCERFNVPSPPLELWPAQKIADYTVIMLVEAEVESEQQKSSTGSAPAPSRPAKPPDAETLQRLRDQARPLPAPPPQS